jgi:hypothetical protein
LHLLDFGTRLPHPQAEQLLMRTGRKFAATLLTLAAASVAADSSLAAPGATDAAAVARMVQSFVEYARWPGRRDPVRLCVVGPAQHAGRLGELRLADGRAVQRRNLAASALPGADCDVAYLGPMTPTALRAATTALRGRGVLTIAEADPTCRSQAMFCLIHGQQTLSFRLNIDAVSRSGMKVDPRVLRMAQGAL